MLSPVFVKKNPDYVIFLVGTNKLNSELPPERKAKSIIDVAKNTQSDSRIVSISGIVPRNGNFNIKAMEVNEEVSKMCDKEKLLFLIHSNIDPKTHLNKSKLHLNRNGYETASKNFVNFILNNYNLLPETNKKANIDIGVSSTSSTLNEKSDIDNEIVDHITNADLKSLRIRNLNKIVVGHLNINSIRNKFDFLAHQVKGNIDILMISETKLDESFPPSQFFLDGYSVPFRLDRNGNGGGILLYIRDDLPSKLLSMNKNIEGFFVEINLRNKKKWLLSCSYNPTKMQISNHLAELSKNTDLYLTKYDQLLFLGDFNAGVEDSSVKNFCSSYNLTSMINRPTCYKNPEKPCIDLILTNCPRSFQNSCAIETGLSDFHKLVVTVMKTTYKKSQPKIINYRSYKYFNSESFREELIQIEANGNNCDESFKNFTSSCSVILNKHTLKKKSVDEEINLLS